MGEKIDKINSVQSGVSSTSAKEVPVGVKVLAILQYIGAGFMVLFGLFFIFGANFIVQLFETTEFSLSGASALFIFIGVVFIGIAVLYFFLAKGLWTGQNWARITSVVFLCFGVLSALISLLTINPVALVSLAFNGFFAGYLLFNKEVKEVFEQTK